MQEYARKIFVTYDPLSETEDGLEYRMRYFFTESDGRTEEITEDGFTTRWKLLNMSAKAVGTPVMDFFSAALGLVVSAALGYALFPLTTPTAGFIIDVSWTTWYNHYSDKHKISRGDGDSTALTTVSPNGDTAHPVSTRE
ncbi:MAG: hypothetical protein IMW86_03935 [Hydrogenibacillus sp.]|nr:hypothetical protein [Hydrogenibacillus sp.]